MRLARPQISVRRLMVAVAIVAVVLTGWQMMARRSAGFRQLALDHRDWAEVSELAAAIERPFLATARRERALQAKYERAARYPWLPIAPDPPEPE